MRVVVTGGSGRVGRVTVDALANAGHQIVVVDRLPPAPGAPSGVEFVQAGADNYTDLLAACAGAEAIVHLAGIPKPAGFEPTVVHNNNVTASYNVLCAAVALGIDRVLLASSVNAIGMTWSRDPQFEYFPVDERHPTRNEDPYSLSKWIGEQQADSIVRAHPDLSVGSLRLHMFMRDRDDAVRHSSGEWEDAARRGLWGYTTHRMWTDAVISALTAPFTGHQILWVVAADTASNEDSAGLARTHFPHVTLRKPLMGNAGFFDCGNTERVLGWSA